MRILLLCSGGMSTSVLVNKMIEKAQERNLDVTIEARGLFQIKDVIAGADVVLLAPQISYALDSVLKNYPDYKFGVIDRLDYGRMRGEAVLDQAMKIINT